MTKEHPALMNEPMVEATLDGRKTQTRRVLKPAFGKKRPIQNLKYHGEGNKEYSGLIDDPWSWGYPFAEDGCDMPLAGWPELNPYGMPGDHLWVREAFGWRDAGFDCPELMPVYRAGGDNKPDSGKWSPSIHMPREASRITLLVTSVRVERLQAISREDAIAEGILVGNPLPEIPESKGQIYSGLFDDLDSPFAWTRDPRQAFIDLWKSINTKPGTTWEDNPWVWVTTFNHIKGDAA